MNCPYTGCLLKCRSKAVHRGRYAGITMSWKKRVFQLNEKINSSDETKENETQQSKMIDYDKLREFKILWPLDR